MNISDYIKSNELLKKLDYEVVYSTIYELIKDGYILEGGDDYVRTV